MCLVVVACVCSLAVPSYADELDDDFYWFNVLDYAGINGTLDTEVYIPQGTTEIYFYLPSSMSFALCDIIVRTDSNDLEISSFGQVQNKYLISTSFANIFRFQGSCGGGVDSVFRLSLTSSTPCAVIFEKLTLSTLVYDFFDDVLNSTLYTALYGTLALTFDPANLPASGYANLSFGSSTDPSQAQFVINAICPNWKKYDYLDIICSVHCMSIESIDVYFGGQSVPFSVNYLDGQTGINNTWIINLSIDLSDLSRYESEIPTLRIQGKYQTQETNFWRIYSVVGGLNLSHDSEQFFFTSWFKQILTELSSMDNMLADLGTINVNISEMSRFLESLPMAIGQLISSQTSALQDSLVSMTSSVRGMFTALNGWISDQTTALSNKLDEVIGVLNPEADSSAADSLLDQSQQIHDFESSHQDVLSNGLTTMQGAASISRPHFASALSFIGTVSSAAFQKLDFMQIIYTLPLVIGLIMFLASRAPGRRHDSPRKVDESKPSRHYQHNDAGGYYSWDGHV